MISFCTHELHNSDSIATVQTWYPVAATLYVRVPVIEEK